ncbi:hypothetical protein DWW11_05870 [Bifidobacterium longum]|nr:hypothetical protein DWW11_05870 [Bifidobacterium longum]RGV62405.1 hypothetical protein DWW06_05725 [Bifidobacterium longum]
MSSLMVSSHSAATSNVSRYFHCMDKGSYCEHCYGITVNDYVRCPRSAHSATFAPSRIVEHANQADQIAAIPCADHRIRMLQCLEQPFRPLRRFPTYRLEQRLNLLNSKPLLFRVFDSHGPSRQP